MRIVNGENPIVVAELTEMAGKMFGRLVKAVIDVKQQIMVINAELHADEEQELLERGSAQADLWGINLYPELFGTEDFVEFDSIINMRPVMENRSRGVEDEQLQREIIRIVCDLVKA